MLGAEGGEAGLLDLGEGAFADDVGALEVVVAVDEDEEAAVVDVAEAFRDRWVARDAEPEDVDGDAFFDDVKVRGGYGGGVAAVAADDEVGADLVRAFGGLGDDAGDAVGGSVVDEAGGLPAHAEGEVGELCGFGGEEVEEVPLRHEGDELGDGGEVARSRRWGRSGRRCWRRGGRSAEWGMEEAVEEAELVEELEGGGVDGVAAEVAEEVGCFSRTVTATPARARRKPSMIPAGPPPMMQQVVLVVGRHRGLAMTFCGACVR